MQAGLRRQFFITSTYLLEDRSALFIKKAYLLLLLGQGSGADVITMSVMLF